MTKQERTLLSILANTDELVGKPFYDSNNVIITYLVMSGVPTKTESRPLFSSLKKTYTDPVIVKTWTTDEEKLDFLQKFGGHMTNPIFQEYNLAAITELDARTRFADIEIHLLKRLANGEFDGPLNHYWEKKGGSTGFCEIKDGVPIQFTQGKSTRVFDGKENEVIPGRIRIYLRYNTDELKIKFFRTFGRDMTDEEVLKYYWDNWEKRYQK
mgnify:CR=1 FL=1